MIKSRSIVFLMPDGPKRRMLWNEEAHALASEFRFNVHLPTGELSPRDLAGADAVVTSWGSPRLDVAFLREAPELRILGHAAGSVRPVVSDALYERGIRVSSANGEMARCVAQWSLMATLVSLRRITDFGNFGDHRRLHWEPSVEPLSPHRTAVGLWGYGAISRELIRMLRALGTGRILVCSEYLEGGAERDDGLEIVDLPTLFAESQITHILTSQTPERIGRVDAQLLGRMPDGATLVNAGRAHLVQEKAMMDELRSGRLHACLDVYHDEPLPADHPLRNLSNVLLTPHNAGNGSQDLYVPLMLQEIQRCFAGEPLHYEILAKQAASMTVEYKNIDDS